LDLEPDLEEKVRACCDEKGQNDDFQQAISGLHPEKESKKKKGAD
jgi:hypothetical protein